LELGLSPPASAAASSDEPEAVAEAEDEEEEDEEDEEEEAGAGERVRVVLTRGPGSTSGAMDAPPPSTGREAMPRSSKLTFSPPPPPPITGKVRVSWSLAAQENFIDGCSTPRRSASSGSSSAPPRSTRSRVLLLREGVFLVVMVSDKNCFIAPVFLVVFLVDCLV